ncbi:lipoprotein [Sulfitobacter sp. LCG007]
MRQILLTLGIVAALSACGGRKNASVPTTLFETGPIYSACLKLNKREASRERCGCVQAVADMSLSGGEQRKGAKLFKDPHRAQEVRQSDRSSDERFWLKWRAFGEQSERYCRAT